MSGIIGHSLYAVLGAKAAAHRGLGIVALATRNFPSYLAGAYLGCDIQVMPEAICVDTGREVGASDRTLMRAFRSETGLGFQEWRTRARVTAAFTASGGVTGSGPRACRSSGL